MPVLTKQKESCACGYIPFAVIDVGHQWRIELRALALVDISYHRWITALAWQ